MASQSDLIQSLIQKSKPGKRSSIYSICSAHPAVIEASHATGCSVRRPGDHISKAIFYRATSSIASIYAKEVSLSTRS